MGSSWIWWGLTWVGKCCEKVGPANWANLFFCLLWCEPVVFHLRVNSRAHPLKTYKQVSPYGVGHYFDMAVSPTRSHLLCFQHQQKRYMSLFQISNSSNSDPIKRMSKRRDTKVSVLVLWMNIAFFTCWMPYGIVALCTWSSHVFHEFWIFYLLLFFEKKLSFLIEITNRFNSYIGILQSMFTLK